MLINIQNGIYHKQIAYQIHWILCEITFQIILSSFHVIYILYFIRAISDMIRYEDFDLVFSQARNSFQICFFFFFNYLLSLVLLILLSTHPWVSLQKYFRQFLKVELDKPENETTKFISSSTSEWKDIKIF